MSDYSGNSYSLATLQNLPNSPLAGIDGGTGVAGGGVAPAGGGGAIGGAPGPLNVAAPGQIGQTYQQLFLLFTAAA